MFTRALLPLAAGGALALAVTLLSGTSRAEPSAEPGLDLRPGGEFSFFFTGAPGIIGGWKNPGNQISLGFALAMGRTVRYHPSLGYSYLNKYHGMDIHPATLGFPIPLITGDTWGIALEPLVNIVGVELYFGGRGVAYFFETAAGLAALVNWKETFISLSMSAQVRLFVGDPNSDVLDDSGGYEPGVNLPIRLTAGWRF